MITYRPLAQLARAPRSERGGSKVRVLQGLPRMSASSNGQGYLPLTQETEGSIPSADAVRMIRLSLGETGR